MAEQPHTEIVETTRLRSMHLLRLLLTIAILMQVACVTPGVDGGPPPAVSTVAPAHTAAAHSSTPLASPVEVLTPNPAPTSDPNSLAPQSNHIYLATLSGERVLFVTNTNFQRSFDADGAVTIDPDLGLMVNEDGQGRSPSGFQLLEQPRLVYVAQHDVTWLNFKFDPTGRLMVVSLWYPGADGAHSFLNHVIEIDFDDLTSRILWTYQNGDDRYPGFDGGALIDEIVGHIVVLPLFPCNACDAFTPHAIVLLNVTTGNELYLGTVGDIRIDVAGNVVSYRNLAESRVPCEPSPGCDNDGLRLVYEPAGETLTAQLP
ncbi:MAG TPA: hypothetical protein VFL17_20190 [Anaerolineae bacterium]|nr:hypothetical protein [Anaerolineae bacterium]